MSIPVLYLQGFAYHQGLLSAFNISDSMYPISFEQSLIHSFYFYSGMFQYLVYGAIGWVVVSLPFNIWIEYDKKRRKGSVFLFLEKSINVVQDFVIKYRKSFFGPMVLFIAFYAFFGLMILVLIPYYYGKNHSTKKLKTYKNFKEKKFSNDTELKSVANLTYMKDGATIMISGFVLQASENLISIFSNDQVVTIPMANIITVNYVLDKQEVTK